MKRSQCQGKPVSSDPFGKNTFTLIIDQMHIYSSVANHTNLAHCYHSSSPNYGYKPFRILGPAGATHSFLQCYCITISSNTAIDSTRLTVTLCTCFWHHLIGLQWTFWGVGVDLQNLCILHWNILFNLVRLPFPVSSKTLKASFSIFIPSGSFTFFFIPARNSWEKRN